MLDIVILAAGKGTRMKSSLPKVLHPIAGKPMLAHVLNTARQLGSDNINIVIGHHAELVEQQFTATDVNFVLQAEQLGTGHAVQQALGHLRAGAIALILYGDVPLTSASTLSDLAGKVSDTSMGLLTVQLNNPTGYGRIVRDDKGDVTAIVEQKDATPEQLAISEGNSGMLAVAVNDLQRWLPNLANNNAQKEYYLTDIIAMAKAEGKQITTVTTSTEEEVLGVNDRLQQAQLERFYQRCQAEQLLKNGATIIDPLRFDCRGELTVGQDVVIDVNAVFEGKVALGDGVSIGPNCVIKNATIGDNVAIAANSIIEDSVVEQGCQIGPFARLRPGTELKTNAKVGNFVETKKAIVGVGSKINHLSYVGDAVLGDNVNIGAGTITCNYDGANKFKTEIKNGAFVGSNTALVAPVCVGENATIGAGSTIVKNIDDGQLSVARGKQRNIDNWQRPVKQKK